MSHCIRTPLATAVFLALTLSLTLDCAAQTEAKPSAPKPPPASEEVNSSTAKGDRSRRPGFLFLELDCYDLAGAVAFFHDVAGFEMNRNDGAFLILRSERGELLLNRRGAAPSGAQPVPKVQGPRVEI